MNSSMISCFLFSVIPLRFIHIEYITVDIVSLMNSMPWYQYTIIYLSILMLMHLQIILGFFCVCVTNYEHSFASPWLHTCNNFSSIYT